VMLPIHTHNLSGNAFHVGLVVSLLFLANFIMGFGWGAVSDRIGQRKGILIVGSMVGGAFFFIIPFLGIEGLILIRGVQVIFLACWVLSAALITEFMPEAKGSGVARYYLFMSMGWFIAGMLSGTIYRYDVHLFFYLIGTVAILQGLILIPMVEPRRKMATFTFKSVFALNQIRDIKLLFITVFLLALGTMVWMVMIPVYFVEELNYTEDITAVIIAWSSIPFLLTITLIGQLCDRFGRKKVFFISIFMYMAMFAGFALQLDLFWILTLWIMPSYGLLLVSSTAMVADLTDPHERARGVGLQAGAVNLGSFIGAILGGAIFAWTDSYPILFGFACIFPVLALVVGVGLKETLRQ